MRRIAVVGDMLSNGGEVCSYEGPKFLMHGAFSENLLKSLPGKRILSASSCGGKATATRANEPATDRGNGKPGNFAATTHGLPTLAAQVFDNGKTWRARLGSNQQPLPSEGSTLSIELRAHRRKALPRRTHRKAAARPMRIREDTGFP
jgi:hypothetical protein